MYPKKSPVTLVLIGFSLATILLTTGCEESSVDDAAVEAPESETSEAAPSTELVEVTTEVAIPAPAVEISEGAAQPETIEAAPSLQPAEVISEIVAPAPAVEVFEEATQSETAEAAPSAEPAEVISEVAIPAPVVEVSQNELIEIVGYLTAQGGGVASLQLDEASINALSEGLQKCLNGEINIMKLPQDEVEAAFGEAQARAEAAQAGSGELPPISAASLEKIGVAVVMQSGLQQLGFGACLLYTSDAADE